jgi:hypothetical protein
MERETGIAIVNLSSIKKERNLNAYHLELLLWAHTVTIERVSE